MNHFTGRPSGIILILALLMLLMLGGLRWGAPAPAHDPGVAQVAATASPVPTHTAMATTAPSATATPQATETMQPRATASATLTPLPPTATPALHVVAEGETLLAIATGYGLAVEALVAANDLQNPNQLTVGQQLRVPPRTAANAAVPLPTRDYGYAILGYSVEGRAVEAFSFGEGDRHLVFVGAIHGGHEWNTALLAYEIVDYLNGNRDAIPDSLTVHVVPVANPDGLYRVTGSAGRFNPGQVSAETSAGRFNGRFVDLNRNWSCDWSASARWGGRAVDPGSEPFSEPETRALRDYFLRLRPQAVVFWHSAAGLVAPGRCGDGDAGSQALASLYGEAAGYPARPFTAYEVSGTASDWLNSQGIAAVTVELYGHETTESGANLAGVLAVLDSYR